MMAGGGGGGGGGRGGGGGGGGMGRLHLGGQKPKGPKSHIFRRTVGLFRPFAKQMGLLLVLIIVSTVLTQIPVLMIRDMTAEFIGGDPDTGRISRLALLAVGLYVAGGLLNVLVGYINQLVGQGLMFNLRESLHTHLQRLPVRFFTSTRTGEIMSRIVTDVNTVQQSVSGTFTEFLTNLITLGVALGLMFMLEWRLALLATLMLPLWVYPTIRVGNVQRRLQREWQEEAAELSANLEETLSISGTMLVKSFGRQEYEAGRFQRSNDTLRRLSIRRLMAGRWFNMATELFGHLSLIAVFWLGGLLVVGGDVGPEDIVAFSVLISRVFTPFRQIARINTTVLSSLALFERIFEYLDLPVEVDEPEAPRPLARARGEVRFDGVTFAYSRGSRPALDDVTFEVPAGRMIALVGPSGAGKTTVTYLLQRFYDPQEGAVRLDRHDLRELSLNSISRAVGAVMQDTYLFHVSLTDNIRYGRLDATDDEVRAAADAAGLGPMIDRLPRGLDTVVGERGFRLSGGEKQRVAIARAILKDPPVLILDEATASLDSRLEREIREATARLAEGRTTIVIAHRLSTVVAADEILVFDHGRIVERGPHAQLLANEGLYAQLYREQFSVEGHASNGRNGAAAGGLDQADEDDLALARGGGRLPE